MLYCTDGLREFGEDDKFNQFSSGLLAMPPHCYPFPVCCHGRRGTKNLDELKLQTTKQKNPTQQTT